MTCRTCGTRVRVVQSPDHPPRRECAPGCRAQQRRTWARAARASAREGRRSIALRVRVPVEAPRDRPALPRQLAERCGRDGALLMRVEALRDFATRRLRGVYACGHEGWADPWAAPETPVVAPAPAPGQHRCGSCAEWFTPDPAATHHERVCPRCRKCTCNRGPSHPRAHCPRRATGAA